MGSVELSRPASELRIQLAAAKADGEAILNATPKESGGLAVFRSRYLSWESKTSAVLENGFKVSGTLTPSPKGEFTATAAALLDLKVASTTIPWDRLPEVVTDIREKIRVLDSIEDRLDVYQYTLMTPSPSQPAADAPIFLVHGHDLARRETVRHFLSTVTDRDIIVLANQPNRGQDLLGKLLSHAQQAAFAVVLLTPDDEGKPRESENNRARARQNVVFELGLFIGILGRDRVAALNHPSVEIPTDFSGVAYISIEGEGWQIELARELKAAGIDVSLDKAL